MKKVLMIVLCIFLAIGGCFSSYHLFLVPKINLQYSEIKVVYKDMEKELTEKDSRILFGILNKRKLFSDNPSCGFTEDVSLRFSNRIICIACDACPKFKDQTTGKYFSVSTQERKEIDGILQKYEVVFPCV